MMSVASSTQGGGIHPKLPPCVNVDCREDCFHNQGQSVSNKVTIRRYSCANCQASLEYRNYGALGVLVWITDPYSRRLANQANTFFRNLQEQLDAGRATLPPVPEGLHVHVQSAKGWRNL